MATCFSCTFNHHRVLKKSVQVPKVCTEPITLPCVGLHESYGVCMQGEHQSSSPANSQCYKMHK